MAKKKSTSAKKAAPKKKSAPRKLATTARKSAPRKRIPLKEQPAHIRITALLAIIVGAGLIIYATINIAIWFFSNRENSKINDALQSSVVIEDSGEDGDKKYNVDFKSLKKQNEDTVGYVVVNGTKIKYTVVQGNNNNYYLRHNFKKVWNVAGWIFADYRNKLDGTDKNIVIFGHNTKNGSMFGSLKNVITKKWYEKEENQKVVFVTEKGTHYYQVFSTYSVEPEEYSIKTEFKKGEFAQFVETVKSRSVYDYGVDVTKKDQILTLSSCLGSGEKRVVLHAKLLK